MRRLQPVVAGDQSDEVPQPLLPTTSLGAAGSGHTDLSLGSEIGGNSGTHAHDASSAQKGKETAKEAAHLKAYGKRERNSE